jgi:hypothetical protein
MGTEYMLKLKLIRILREKCYPLLVILALLFYSFIHLANSDETVTGASESLLTSKLDLPYSPSSQTLNTRHWKYKGQPVNWQGDPLVQTNCNSNNAIRILINTDVKSETYECRDGTLLSEKFAEALNANMMLCTQQAMTQAKIPGRVTKIDINSLNILNQRRVNNSRGCTGQSLASGKGSNCSISYHATGRAIDITTLDVTLADGTKKNLPLSCTDMSGNLREGFEPRCVRYGPLGAFYDNFSACWNEKVSTVSPCAKGALTCSDNKQHINHVHLSLPICPKVRGIATT